MSHIELPNKSLTRLLNSLIGLFVGAPSDVAFLAAMLAHVCPLLVPAVDNAVTARPEGAGAALSGGKASPLPALEGAGAALCGGITSPHPSLAKAPALRWLFGSSPFLLASRSAVISLARIFAGQLA